MRRIYVYTWRLQIIFILYTHRQTLHFLLFSFPFQFGLFDFLGRMFVFGAISRFEHFRQLRLSSSVWLYTFLLLKSLRLCVFLLRGWADFRFRTQRQSTCCWKRQLYVESATSAADYVVATLHLTGDKAMDRSLVHRNCAPTTVFIRFLHLCTVRDEQTQGLSTLCRILITFPIDELLNSYTTRPHFIPFLNLFHVTKVWTRKQIVLLLHQLKDLAFRLR